MKIRAYIGIDLMSRLTEQVLREFQVYVTSIYGIKIEVEAIELPVLGGEEEKDIPLVMVDGRVISLGEPPSLAKLVDELFNIIETSQSKTLMGFPILGDYLEEAQANAFHANA